MRPSFRFPVLLVLVVLLSSAAPSPLMPTRAEARGADAPSFDKTFFSALKWRSIGPNRGGRSIAVAGSAASGYTPAIWQRRCGSKVML